MPSDASSSQSQRRTHSYEPPSSAQRSGGVTARYWTRTGTKHSLLRAPAADWAGRTKPGRKPAIRCLWLVDMLLGPSNGHTARERHLKAFFHVDRHTCFSWPRVSRPSRVVWHGRASPSGGAAQPLDEFFAKPYDVGVVIGCVKQLLGVAP